MNEQQYKELLKKLGIALNKSYAEAYELLYAKLNEFLDRTDADAEQMVSDIQDAMDYIEPLVEREKTAIALAPAKGEVAEETEEIDEELLKRGAKRAEKRMGTSTYSTGTSSGAGNTNGSSGKPWFCSLTGEPNVDGMFALAEADLSQRNYKQAESIFDTILRTEAGNAGAYMGKALAKWGLRDPKDSATCYADGFEKDSDLLRAKACGNDKQKKFIEEALEERRKGKIYTDAEKVLNISKDSTQLLQAAADFDSINTYRDAKKKAQACRNAADKAKVAEKKRRKEEEKRQKDAKKKWKREEWKRRIKALRKVAPLIIILVAGIYFLYSRFLSPTYYGTKYYFGNKFHYKEYKIADTATTIAPYIFKGLDIEAIEIPASVETIEEGAFQDCANLKSIEIPASVKSIGDYAFKDCTSLENVTFSENLERIGMSAFEGCTTLDSVNFPTTISHIGYGAFEGCYSMKEAIFDKESMVLFERNVFANCSGLKKLELPKFVEDPHASRDIVSNCCNLNVEELDPSYGIARNYLYGYPVGDVPLMADENQFLNAVWAKRFEEPASQGVDEVSDEGIISNIQIGKEVSDGDKRSVEFAFDYQEDMRLMHLSGSVSDVDGIQIVCESTDMDPNQLLIQGEDGNYPAVQKMLAGKTFATDEGEFVFDVDEIFVNTVNISESKQDITEKTIYDINFQFDVNKPIGTLAVSGSMHILEANVAEAEWITDSLECTGWNLVGTYEYLEDGNIHTVEIRQLAEELYVISPIGMEFEILFCRPTDWNGEEGWLKWGTNYPPVAINWNENWIAFSTEGPKKRKECTKVSDEVIEVSQQDAKLAGVWSGLYMSSDQTITAAVTKYIIPIGLGKYASVFDFGPQPGHDDYASGRILEVGHYNELSGNVYFEGREFLDYPKGYSFADFEGTMNEDGTEIIGEEPWVFKLTKTGELEDLSGILTE